MTAILTVQNVEKAFGARRVLAGVSLAVHEEDRIGLVGVNGSGKSTLLRLMMGEGDGPDDGLITRKRNLRVEYVTQEPEMDPGATVEDVLREGLRARAAATGEDEDSLTYELRGLSAALKLPPRERPVMQLSIGERRRVALARALLAAPELLALDEPTNHLDAATVDWLEERLRERQGALVLVTHDRYFLDRVATRIIELDRGQIYSYEGNYSSFLEKQAERLGNETAREKARASFVRRELDWIRRGPAARTTKQQARIDRFDSAVAAKPDSSQLPPRTLSLRLPVGPRLGKTILDLEGLTLAVGGKKLFSDLTLAMKPGDRIGVIGENGAGKTTLVRTILGMQEPDAGKVTVGVNTKFAFLDQARSDLRDENSVLQEVAGDHDQVFLEDGPIHVRTFLRMMLFDDGFADTPVATLSGGERNRVQLARLLRLGGNFLILDEPTNDLDLVTLGVLEEALAEFPGCALVVSHDRWFLDRVATGILAFEGDGQVSFHEGNYSDYHARRAAAAAQLASAEKAAERAAAAERSGGTARTTKAAGPKKISFKEKQELAGIEAAITAAETRVKDLEATLSDPNVYKDRASEVPGMVASLDTARHEVERLYARWQELEAIAAASPA
jgi:ATP-binding cassette subfamily F protein uup